MKFSLVYFLSILRCISDHGREARFPFLDENVVSFLQDIPIWIKVRFLEAVLSIIEIIFSTLSRKQQKIRSEIFETFQQVKVYCLQGIRLLFKYKQIQ